MMKIMMGEQGEEQMHISLAQNITRCYSGNNSSSLSNLKGGAFPMMGWGFENMMGGWNNFGLFSLFASIFWLVGLIDLMLLGIFLWKKINC